MTSQSVLSTVQTLRQPDGKWVSSLHCPGNSRQKVGKLVSCLHCPNTSRQANSRWISSSDHLDTCRQPGGKSVSFLHCPHSPDRQMVSRSAFCTVQALPDRKLVIWSAICITQTLPNSQMASQSALSTVQTLPDGEKTTKCLGGCSLRWGAFDPGASGGQARLPRTGETRRSRENRGVQSLQDWAQTYTEERGRLLSKLI